MPVIKSALLLVPSDGRGGGIETFVDSLAAGLRELGTAVEILALTSASRPRVTVGGQVAFTWRATWRGALSPRRADLLLAMHPSLTPIAIGIDLLRRGKRPRPQVFFYGIDIWATRRWRLRLLRLFRLSALTISSFSAGALAGAGAGKAITIPPTLSPERYRAFTTVRRRRGEEDLKSPSVLTVFRLDQAEGKGVTALVEAMERLRERWPATLVVAGRGPAPELLQVLATDRIWMRIVESPTLEDLAGLYRDAAIFVLATRTRPWDRARPTGEGFGLVLAEAQLAGVPVVAPASGGSSDAFIEGVTGLRANDEGTGALVDALSELLDHPQLYAQMSANAAAWSAWAFSPRRGTATIRIHILGLDALSFSENPQGKEVTVPELILPRPESAQSVLGDGG